MSARSRRKPAHASIRAIIYARVSKDDDGRGRSPEEQIDSCLEDCEYEGWPVAEILKDNNRGASRHSRREREDYKRLPELLRSGDVLVVWEPSRITRDMKEFSQFCDMCAERGVRLYYDSRVWDLADDDDRNRVWQDILDGAKQVGKTRKRVLRAMAANVDKCKPHGKEAPGYRIVRDARTGKPIRREPDPLQASILQEAARRALNHESLRSIGADLAPRWIAARGGRFAAGDIKRFLISPTTFGFRVHYGEIVGSMPGQPAVDPKLYAPLQALLTNPARLMHHGTEPKWLLSHIARCGACVELGERGVIRRKRRGPNSRGTDRYECIKYGHVSRTIIRVDAYVEEFLLRLLEHPETMKKLTAKDEEAGRAIDAELATIAQLDAELATFVREAAATRMSAATVAAYVEPLEADAAAARDRLKAMTVEVDPVLAAIVGPDAREKWAALDDSIERKRDIIRASMTVTIMPIAQRGAQSDIGVEVRPLRMLA